ncbi:serine protease [Streptomyces yaizuensis]|uniref:Serine protease n=1 Tax=Streptomyces yaizuensis TaxID=2989713 RepID=A0ABQ5P6X8_9ACTN|nr:serine protease [Streptomyces sp. YSPA8]GLF98343.1 serine protease [Streptomyces sp. YSPA8]
MSTSSVPRRGVLRALALTVALVGGTIPATGATALAAQPETFTLTIHHLDGAGRATGEYTTNVHGLTGPRAGRSVHPHDASGTTTVELPRGRYALDSAVLDGPSAQRVDWIVQPRLDLDRDTTVTVDARTTAPVDVRPPDASADLYMGAMMMRIAHDGIAYHPNVSVRSAELRVAHLGPDAEPGSVRQWYDSYWNAGNARYYALGYHFTGARALTGLTRHPSAADLATVRVSGATRPGSTGHAAVFVTPRPGPAVGYGNTMATPGTSTFVVTPERGTWEFEYAPRDASGRTTKRYSAGDISVRAGGTTELTFDNGVFGPDLTGRPGAVREGDRISVDVPLLADGAGHVPESADGEAPVFTLHRDGVRVPAESNTPGRAGFTVPPGRASYRLTGTARLSGTPGTATRVTSEWTFMSATTGGPAALPLSAVRFSPGLGPDGTAPAGTDLRIPVTVQGAAANGRIRSLVVSASTDGGATWTRLPVAGDAVTVPGPGAGTGVSLRAELTDTEGNTLVQTTADAYRTR